MAYWPLRVAIRWQAGRVSCEGFWWLLRGRKLYERTKLCTVTIALSNVWSRGEGRHVHINHKTRTVHHCEFSSHRKIPKYRFMFSFYIFLVWFISLRPSLMRRSLADIITDKNHFTFSIRHYCTCCQRLWFKKAAAVHRLFARDESSSHIWGGRESIPTSRRW